MNLRWRHARFRERGFTMMELLIAAAIGVIVTGFLIMLWFNINKSSSMTVSHAEARDFARDGIARLSREVRDAEASTTGYAVVEASETSLAFTTTFNRLGAEVDATKPRLIHYYYDPGADERALYRDVYADGVTDLHPAPPTPTPSPVRHDVVIPHVLNGTSSPMFSYTYVDSANEKVPQAPVVTDPDDLSRILLVHVYVLVDLDPGKAPNPMEIKTQAQLRNQRIVD